MPDEDVRAPSSPNRGNPRTPEQATEHAYRIHSPFNNKVPGSSMHITADFAAAVGNTPLIRLNRLSEGDRLRDSRQGRVHESRRLGQGSRGALDRPRAREERRAQTRRHGRGRHGRQHRHRPGTHLQCARLPVRDLHAGQPVAGEGGDPEDPGSRSPRRAHRALPRRDELPEAGRALRGQPRQRRLGEPVRQHRQPPGALRVHRARDLAADRWSRGRVRVVGRHRGHARRCRRLPQGTQDRRANGPGRLHGQRPL